MDTTSLHSLQANVCDKDEKMTSKSRCTANINVSYIPLKLIYFCFLAGQSSVIFRSVFMKHLGMSTTQNGIIYAIDRVLGIVFPPILGAISDKSKRPKTVIRWLLISGSILCALQIFIPPKDLNCFKPDPETNSSRTNSSALPWKPCRPREQNNSCIETNKSRNAARYHECGCVCNQYDVRNTQDSHDVTNSYDITFWSLLALTLLSSISIFGSNGLLDALIFYKFAAEKRHTFGTQRMWGSVGFGAGALTLGYLKDAFATLNLGANSAFIPFAFYPLIFWTILCVATKFVDSKQAEESQAPKIEHIKIVVKDVRMIFFMIYTTAVGYSVACGEIYLFWLAEEKFNASGAILGVLVITWSALDTLSCFASGFLVKKFGSDFLMVIGLFLLGLRIALYTTATQAWHLVVIDSLRGGSWTITWIACCNHIASISPPELRATTMSVASACLWGVGYGTCGIVGGILYEKVGGENMFLISFGLVMCSCVVYVVFLIVHRRVKRNQSENKRNIPELNLLTEKRQLERDEKV